MKKIHSVGTISREFLSSSSADHVILQNTVHGTFTAVNRFRNTGKNYRGDSRVGIHVDFGKTNI